MSRLGMVAEARVGRRGTDRRRRVVRREVAAEWVEYGTGSSGDGIKNDDMVGSGEVWEVAIR